jgi:hypothetical protein
MIPIHRAYYVLAHAPVAQWIEQQTSDLWVGGSSPSGRAILLNEYDISPKEQCR